MTAPKLTQMEADEALERHRQGVASAAISGIEFTAEEHEMFDRFYQDRTPFDERARIIAEYIARKALEARRET
jgi:hypothetical protein